MSGHRLQFRVNGLVVFDMPMWSVFWHVTERWPANGATVEARITLGDHVHAAVIEFPTDDDADESEAGS